MLLSIVLALGVLFLVIGIFNGNLKDMVANSGFNNITKTKDTTAQYSQTENSYANSQVNVRITGAQGLTTIADFKTDALKNITALSQKTPFTDADAANLAKALTIYGRASAANATGQISAVAGVYNNLSGAAKASVPLNKIYFDNGKIDVKLLDGTTKTVEWKLFNTEISTNAQSILDANRLKVLNELNKSNF